VSSVPFVASYSYLPATKELASVGTGTHTTQYDWVAGRLDQVTSLAPFAAFAFKYSYLPGSELLAKTTYLDGTVTVWFGYTYDEVGNRLEERRAGTCPVCACQ